MSSVSSDDFAKDNKVAFQPFGLGRHACIGQSLAYSEMRLILARLFFAFDIELANAQDVWDWGSQETYIFWEKKPLNVRLSIVGH
jgi:cytochrome P450